MKKCISLFVGVVACASFAAAGPCTNGTLAAYEALGATGCTIGTNTVFDFVTLSGTSGASQIDPGSVSIAPSGGTANPTLMFTIVQAPADLVSVETMFDYQISGNAYTGNTLDLSGSSELNADGAVTDLQNVCINGTWDSSGVTTCFGSGTASLTTLDGIQNDDSAVYTASTLAVTDDIEVTGEATGAVGTDAFSATSAVPEPSTLALLGAGAAISALLKSRNRGKA